MVHAPQQGIEVGRDPTKAQAAELPSEAQGGVAQRDYVGVLRRSAGCLGPRPRCQAGAQVPEQLHQVTPWTSLSLHLIAHYRYRYHARQVAARRRAPKNPAHAR